VTSSALCYDHRMTNPILLAVLTFAMMTGTALAQQRTFYDSRGNVVGRAATDSNGATTNYDARGKVISRESTSENTTTIYDSGERSVSAGSPRRHRGGEAHV
jgi:YD repeat-containing protein